MKLFLVFALVAAAAAQISNDYLPPHVGGAVAASAPAPEVVYAAPTSSVESYDVSASAPAHSFSDADGYRYKTQRRRVVKTARRHRRQVSSEYLPPVAAYSAPAASYAAPAPAPVASYSAPAPVTYAAPAAAVESYDVAASAPAHSFSDADGYRYKTQRRRVVKTARRHRRQVSSEYLPPVASYSAPAASYAAPAPAPVASYSAPAPVSYAAPAAAVESYDVAASAPAHSFSDADGYRYKTQRRRVVKTARRHRRQVSSEYLPPVASYSAPAASYAAPAPAPVASYSAPAPVSHAAPAAAVESYDVAASAPAHSFSDADGYRYKTQRRRVVKTARRHRRQVSSEYLPPVASYSAPAASYAAPAPVASYSASAPVSYAAPAAAVESYDVAASAPAHSFSDADGYRYKTQRRRVVKTARRHRRQVSSEYLPPVASNSAPAASYAAPAPVASYSAPAPVSYAAPAAAVESYDVAASAPAHSFSDADGYRYKTQRRRVVKTARRHRRQVSSEYLPPVASNSAPAASYAAPAPVASYSAPAPVSYAAPAAAVESYDVAASAPAHSFSDADGYRYRTQRRRVIRRHRN